MPDLYGGLFLENLVNQDFYYDLQCGLFQQGFIQGIQLRVAHPIFTTVISEYCEDLVNNILRDLPDGCKVFIHCGGENVGVDFGQINDEKGIKTHSEFTWESWNKGTIDWALIIVEKCRKLGIFTEYAEGLVVHPGYLESPNDVNRWNLITKFLSDYQDILLENLPWMTPKPGYITFELDEVLFGAGGTPHSMEKLLRNLPGRKCLIDLSHLILTYNQILFHGLILKYKNLDSLFQDFIQLPHSSVCHFSGVPVTNNILRDEHKALEVDGYVPLIEEAFREMKVICLEIPFENLENSKRSIGAFRESYNL